MQDKHLLFNWSRCHPLLGEIFMSGLGVVVVTLNMLHFYFYFGISLNDQKEIPKY